MNRKRILSLLMAGALSVSLLATSAMAAGGLPGITMEESEWEGFEVNMTFGNDGASNVNINMDNKGAKGSTYSAYQLMSLKSSLKSDESVHAGHAANEHGNDCYNYAYAVNPKYRAALAEVTGATGADDKAVDAAILKAIGELGVDDVRGFADSVWGKIRTMEADKSVTDAEGDGESFTGMGPGYYLIAETEIGEQPDSASLVMLDTANDKDITVVTKEDVPSIEKKIIDGDKRVDSVVEGYQDYVQYELVITPPDSANLSTYTKYAYVVHDAISEGLTFVNDGEHAVKVYVGSVAEGNLMSAGEYTVSSGDKTGCKGPVGCNLEISFDDVKSYLLAGNDIIVRYFCQVNEKAIMGSAGTPGGNPNTVNLQFSNDPYGDGLGETPKDTVTVFALKLLVDKVGADEETALDGAAFTLYIKDPDADGADDDGWVKFGDGQQTGLMWTDGHAHFEMNRLRKGDYKLEETTVPTGYHKADDVFFTVNATSTDEMDESGNVAIETLTVEYNGQNLAAGEKPSFDVRVADGELATKVVNMTGNRLPSTGGSGVYALYAGGAVILVVAVGAAVVSKKKKENA